MSLVPSKRRERGAFGVLFFGINPLLFSNIFGKLFSAPTSHSFFSYAAFFSFGGVLLFLVFVSRVCPG
jgi:hypothetical protein